jgi:hypothetical protein
MARKKRKFEARRAFNPNKRQATDGEDPEATDDNITTSRYDEISICETPLPEITPTKDFSEDVINIVLDHLIADCPSPRDTQKTVALCALVSINWYCAAATRLYNAPTVIGKTVRMFAEALGSDTSRSTIPMRNSGLGKLVKRLHLDNAQYQSLPTQSVVNILTTASSSIEQLTLRRIAIRYLDLTPPWLRFC